VVYAQESVPHLIAAMDALADAEHGVVLLGYQIQSPANLDASRRQRGGLGRSGPRDGGHRRRAGSRAEPRRAGLGKDELLSVREEMTGGDKVKR
jgi:hypothetical protein